jgi:hypothetical protein
MKYDCNKIMMSQGKSRCLKPIGLNTVQWQETNEDIVTEAEIMIIL